MVEVVKVGGANLETFKSIYCKKNRHFMLLLVIISIVAL